MHCVFPDEQVLSPRNRAVLFEAHRNRRGPAETLLTGLRDFAHDCPDRAVAVILDPQNRSYLGVLHDCTAKVFSLVAQDLRRIIVVGVRPGKPVANRTYIVPGSAGQAIDRDMMKIELFATPSNEQTAARLIRRGALWNTNILIASAATLAQWLHHITELSSLRYHLSMSVEVMVRDLPCEQRRHLSVYVAPRHTIQ